MHAVLRKRSAVRPDLLRCVPCARQIGDRQPTRRIDRPGRCHRNAHPDRLGEHELGHWATAGVGTRSPRRTRRVAPGHASTRPRRGDQMGEAATGRFRFTDLAVARFNRCTGVDAVAARGGTRHCAARFAGSVPRVHQRRKSRDRPAGCSARRPASRGAPLDRRGRRDHGPGGLRPDGGGRTRIRPGAAPRSGDRHAQPHQRTALHSVLTGDRQIRAAPHRRGHRYHRRCGTQGHRTRRGRSRRARARHRARSSERNGGGARARRVARARHSARGGQCRDTRRRSRPRRCRSEHRQGRCRSGSDVHDADDDRGRPPAILGGIGDIRGRP